MSTKQGERDGDVQLTDWELEVVTKVFRSFETGLREGTILTKVIYQPVFYQQYFIRRWSKIYIACEI